MEREQALFMHSVIKQCSNFFLSLHKYCEEYSEKICVNEKPGRKPTKKMVAAQERKQFLT